jgi:MFS superfamily sulfate permease-like transporter
MLFLIILFGSHHAFMQSSDSCAFIVSPYLFPKTDGPRYVMAMLLMMASTVTSMIAAMMKFLLIRANRKLKAEGATNLLTL